MCLLATCVSSSEKMSVLICPLFDSVLCFFDSVLCFFDIELHELFVYFGDQTLVCLQIFSLILWVFFILLMVSFATRNLLENFSTSPPLRENQKQSLYIICCFGKGWHPRVLSHTPQDIMSSFLILSYVEWQREIGLFINLKQSY